eukprot:TRINITY_DN3537_c0_g1_i11.p1 TRINITY_DN3537_c0_g1~~TRINITY_DN3537_c0_g1_i11.p1  ORF type:complete len:313 (+),score=60.98 TRINITY_DN3537_c0_g1_i11:2-940(+)
MINLKSIVTNLQVPECKKENHFNEKLSMICLDKNCPDFLKFMCTQCQTEHNHILYSVKGVINQIIQVISQPNQNQNINQSNASERFDSVLKSINQLISLSQKLLKHVSDQKTQLIGQPSNKTEIAQLLNDISNQDASTIHEKMKKVFSYLNLSLQNQIVITMKQAQEIKQETQNYLDFVQKLVLQAQNNISDSLKQDWKTGSSYLNFKQFVWNNDCEKKMKEDLKSLQPDNYPKECERSYKKWKQLYSTLMQKSEGKQGFCGKNPAYGSYDGKYDKWRPNSKSGKCGTSEDCSYSIRCCKECWEKGEGNKKC